MLYIVSKDKVDVALLARSGKVDITYFGYGESTAEKTADIKTKPGDLEKLISEHSKKFFKISGTVVGDAGKSLEFHIEPDKDAIRIYAEPDAYNIVYNIIKYIIAKPDTSSGNAL